MENGEMSIEITSEDVENMEEYILYTNQYDKIKMKLEVVSENIPIKLTADELSYIINSDTVRRSFIIDIWLGREDLLGFPQELLPDVTELYNGMTFFMHAICEGFSMMPEFIRHHIEINENSYFDNKIKEIYPNRTLESIIDDIIFIPNETETN